MIPNVVKGSDMHGLVQYLAGPGRANEHTNPHVISGDAFSKAWHGTQELDRKAASELAAYLDEPRKVFGTEIRTRCWKQNPQTGEREAVLDVDGRQVYKDVHVWHCSLSLPPGEVASAETWDAIATDFADEMGFTAASGKAPARWVAIHHGASKNGNDHVHIAASMVREDGTRWEGRLRDYPKAQAVCRDLETKYGLTPVAGRQYGTVQRGVQPVERAAAEKAGVPLTAREQLGHLVRSAAVASTSEAEWIRRVRSSGVVIKPRFVAGSTDVVAGYRVALKPASKTDRLNFYGGGQIGNDLSLPRIRENWPEPTIEAADAASAEWQAAFRGQRPTVSDGRETKALGKSAPDVAARNLDAFSRRLSSIPVTDRMAWADAARDVSGALSAWAQHDPANARELQAAAAVLARSAQQQRPGGQVGRRVKDSAMGTALILLSAKSDDQTKIATAVLMHQLMKVALAVRDYHRTTGNVHQAQAVQIAVSRLSSLPVQATPGTATAPVRGLESPLPNPLAPRPQTGARTTREADHHGR